MMLPTINTLSSAKIAEKRTLETLVTELADLDARFRQIRLCPEELKFDADGLRYCDQFLNLNEDDRTQLYRRGVCESV